MKYGLKKEVVDKIEEVLKSHPEIESAILYGSRAKGNYTPGSDIDLTFTGNKLSLEIVNKINWQLDDLLLPYTFDLSIYHDISNPDLIDHIKRAGILFYTSEN